MYMRLSILKAQQGEMMKEREAVSAHYDFQY